MRVRFAQIICLLVAALASSSAMARDATGVFLARFTNGVYLLQLVQTPDQHLTGLFDSTVIEANGTLQNASASVTGAVDGNSISLTLKPISFLPATVTASGTLEGNKLSLIGAFYGGEPSAIVFLRSNVHEYETFLDVTRWHSRAILAQKAREAAHAKAVRAEKEFVSQLHHLVGRMNRFDKAAGVLLSRIPGTERHYRAITAKMSDYLEQEKRIPRASNGGYRRSQYSFVISEGLTRTDQIDSSVQSVEWDFRMSAEPLMKEATRKAAKCDQPEAPTRDQTGHNSDARAATCKRFLELFPLYKQRFDAVAAGLANLKEVYREERRKQQELVQLSERIE